MSRDSRSIFIRNIPLSAKAYELEVAIANVLHSAPLNAVLPLQPIIHPLNFDVTLWRAQAGWGTAMGTLVIPDQSIAKAFLLHVAKFPVVLGSIGLCFELSKKTPATPQQIAALRSEAYAGKEATQQMQRTDRLSPLNGINLQLGHRSREGTFVPTTISTSAYQAKRLAFRCRTSIDGERRILRFIIDKPDTRLTHIVVRLSTIERMYVDTEGSRQAIMLQLNTPASLEGSLRPPPSEGPANILASLQITDEPGRHRLPHIPGAEKETPYVLRHLYIDRFSNRRGSIGLDSFLQNLSDIFGMDDIIRTNIPVSFTGDYGSDYLRQVESELQKLPPHLAFQAQKLLCNPNGLTAKELVTVLRNVSVMAKHNEKSALFALEHMYKHSNLRFPDLNEARESSYKQADIGALWRESLNASTRLQRATLPMDLDSHLRCGHVKVTPTTMVLAGPHVDRSNRVLRQYPEHHDYFIRVTFSEENLVSTRFANDRELIQSYFTREHYGEIMRKGLHVAGRKYDFLAYSQSSLKDGCVWFVAPFRVGDKVITAASIRAGLGDFTKTINRPARYAARLSQAFSATSSSITLRPHERVLIDDIERNGSCFTDGAGCISPLLAAQVNQELLSRGTSERPATAFQIRLGGSKGMLFVNPSLTGRLIQIRPSMEKFSAPNALRLEVSEAFTSAKPCYLNKPLIKILEDLGAPTSAFLALQRRAVQAIEAQAQTIATLPKMLHQYSLGTVYGVSTAIRCLSGLNLTLEDLPRDIQHYLHDCVNFAKATLLRNIKFRGRIALPGCVTLVGGVDESRSLKEGQVFICIERTSGRRRVTHEYIQGPVVVTKSPTTHPGDIRMLTAIGKPTTPFLRAQKNTIVFSANGSRAEPSTITGSDLDGDAFNVITVAQKDIWPRYTVPPYAYPPAIIKDLGRPSTIEDVADFVADFLNTDLLGMVANRHLQLADQYKEGVFHPDCLKLSELHSQAVDFPKSGTPVNFAQLPRPSGRLRPDFMSSEVQSRPGDSKRFYASQKALGVLFRDVEVPETFAYKRGGHEPEIRYMSDAIRSKGWARCLADVSRHKYGKAVINRVDQYFEVAKFDTDAQWRAEDGLEQYVLDLSHIREEFSLSRQPLAEEELYMSVLGGNVRDPRRKETLSQIREETGHLVQRVRRDLLEPDEYGNGLDEDHSALRNAFYAWIVGFHAGSAFGAVSYHFLALNVIKTTLETLDERHTEYA